MLLPALLVLLSAQSVALSAPTSHAALHARPLVGSRARPAACSAAERGGDGLGDEPKLPRAVDISRELSKFSTPGARVRTSNPVRYILSALDDARRAARGFARFWTDLATAVPTNRLMLGLILAAYGVQSLVGKPMLLAGARINNHILDYGQWHRLITPIWLHSSVSHLLSNSYSLWVLGPQAEGIFGPQKFFLLYVLSGVGGNLLGLWLGPSRGMSVGASGAVFGLMGGLAGYALRNRRSPSAQSQLQSIGRILFLNLLIGLRPHSGIDNLGHVGGFLAGGALGLALATDDGGNYNLRSTRTRVAGAALTASTLATLAAVALSTLDFARMTQVLQEQVLLRGRQRWR